MKSITKLSFLAATVAVFATSAAYADDQQLQNQLALQRAQNTQPTRTTTIAVYANGRGIGRSASQDMSADTRFELRTNAHGQTFGAYVAAK